MGRLYLPEWGQPAFRRRPEDGAPCPVLHLTLAAPGEPLVALTRALARFGPLTRIAWTELCPQLGAERALREILAAAAAVRPGLIWMQVQGPGPLADAAYLRALRQAAGPQARLVTWTGDVTDHGAGGGITLRTAPWMLAMCEAVDLFTACHCDYPQALHDAGAAASCGFMQCGFDAELFNYRPQRLAQRGVDGLVWLASRYPTLASGERDALARLLLRELPGRLTCYGGGWAEIIGEAAAGGIDPVSSSYLYSHAPLALSISHSSVLRRYTSDRLMRIMASGGVGLVREFPDMQGLGCLDGETCLVWRTPEELVALARDWLRPARDGDRTRIRQAAWAIAHRHMTWDAAIEELAWMLHEEARRG